ncbi:MAG: 50S ribosomal protein L13 [Candidatus Roizmanbacteria bacterium]|nr:50S ribosomal protein L13 [Candidatus Roizmanbacteria bacterium]
MNRLTQSTKPTKEKQVNRNWHLIDVSGKVLGRIVPQIVRLVQGKHKTDYVPNLDIGDHVVVTNASKVKVTGKKAQSIVYTNYSGYPGGLRTINFADLLKKDSREVIKRAVSGMLPKNKFRSDRLNRVHVFPNAEHSFKDKFINK